ncbi:SpoIIE family protein phosphatase [Streptomyces atriruber]|uniref:SpoIIE family protein phosphatase n=1 Tax=Streptomyces atriruber TaxID=545121 RepID=UPI0024467B60|nr:SpoIIE family protein phosphatase [Streptomyces atriruber]
MCRTSGAGLHPAVRRCGRQPLLHAGLRHPRPRLRGRLCRHPGRWRPPSGLLAVSGPRNGRARAEPTSLPGEALFLYSDGIIEDLTSKGARFGEAGLAAHLTHHAATNRALGASAIIDDLTGLLATFPTGPADDVALLALSATSTIPARASSGASGTAHTSVPLPAKVWDPCTGPPDEGVRRSAGTKAPES